MNGRIQNYNSYEQSLKDTPEPVLLDDIPHGKMDLAGLVRYMKENGVDNAQKLSDEELLRFVPQRKYY